MALPPTAFKDMLHGNHAEIYERLKKKRCLSWRGRWHRDAMIEVMKQAERDFAAWVRAHPRMTGPNGQDRLADALLASPYVNAKAKRLAMKDTR